MNIHDPSTQYRIDYRYQDGWMQSCVKDSEGDIVAWMVAQRGRQWCALRDSDEKIYDIYRDFTRGGDFVLKHSSHVVATATLDWSRPIRAVHAEGRIFCLKPVPLNGRKLRGRFSLYEDGQEVVRLTRKWSFWRVSRNTEIALFLDVMPTTIFFCYGLAFLMWESPFGTFGSDGPPRKRPARF